MRQTLPTTLRPSRDAQPAHPSPGNHSQCQLRQGTDLIDELASLGWEGIHRTYLSDVERGTRNLSLVNIEKLAEALSISMSELFESVEQE